MTCVQDGTAGEANYTELYFGETSGSGLADNASVGEENIHEKISCLSRLQVRSTFYKVEGCLMILLKRCLETECGSSVSIVTDYVDHYQSLQSEDRGWGCGWRNIQMLSSHLLMQRPEAREVLFGGSGFVPDIPSIQRWLEIAWERDFDVPGSYDFNKEVYGSKKWIGTTECAALFRSFGLRARIVDFDRIQSNSSEFLDGNNSGKKSVGRGKTQIAQVCGPMDKYLVNRRSQQADTNSTYEKSEHNGSCTQGASTHKNNDKSTGHGFLKKTTSGGHQILMEWVWNYFSDKRFHNAGNSGRRVDVSWKT